jgi:hypothetical protein
VASIDPFRAWILAAISDQPWCDNHSAIKLSKDPVQHQRKKHIELYMNFIINIIHDQVIGALFYPTEDQVADIFRNFVQK